MFAQPCYHESLSVEAPLRPQLRSQYARDSFTRTRLTALLVLVLALTLAACGNSSKKSSAGQAIDDKGDEKGPLAALDEAQDDSPETLRERRLADLLSFTLEREHLRARKLDDDISKKAFRLYLEQLDPGKMFLLREHAAQLRKYTAEMDDQMTRGRLQLAHEGSEIFVGRVAVVKPMVADILARPFDFKRDETVELDPDKLAYAADDAALRERWRKTLKLQALHRIVRMEEVAKAREKLADKRSKKGAQKAKKKADKKAAKKAPGADGDSDRAHRQRDAIPDTPEGREQKARTDLAEVYNTRFTRLVQMEHIDRLDPFLNAISQVYDPHTSYLQPQRKEDFDIRMSGSLEGIGALLGEDEHFIKVLSIVPGSASWRQGDLEASDLILEVAQEDEAAVDIGDMRLREVVRMIRGKKGTTVTLTVKKPDDEIKTIAIVRDIVEIESTYAKGAVLDHKSAGGSKVGYIYLPSFYGNTRVAPGSTPQRRCTDDVRTLLDTFGQRGIESVILDMRGNGGGLLDDAQAMSGLFIETGPIVQTQGVDGSKEVLRDEDPSMAFRGDLVVLVDRFSASASEILAAAMQDYGRAIVVGTGPTHGKGTVQMLVALDNLVPRSAPAGPPLGVLKLTRMQFFRINGASTQKRGVMPDIVLPDPEAEVESNERFLDHALPWSEVEPLPYKVWTQAGWDRAALTGASRERVAKNPALQAVARRAELLRKRRDDTSEPLARAKWEARRDRKRKELEALVPEDDKRPTLLAVEALDYDGSEATRTRPRPGRSGETRDAGPNPEEAWRADLARDPWVEESVLILRDMGNVQSVAATDPS